MPAIRALLGALAALAFTFPALSQGNASRTPDVIFVPTPQEVVERISGLLTPASSLVISDYGISHETRKDTDFIVVTQ